MEIHAIEDRLEMKNLHQVLESAILDVETVDPEPVMVNARVLPSVREKAHAICAAHNITLSDFIRKALERLVTEYGG